MGRQDPTKVEEIPSLADWYASSAYADWLEDNQEDPRDRREGSQESNGSDQVHDFDEELNKKIAIWKGDITTLEIDAIVNAANNSLLGGGGVDGAIHRAAGRSLYEECKKLDGCDTGDAKITKGHALPAQHIIHTVGPIGYKPPLLQSCYDRCLEVAVENDVKTIAFCCISTGIYGFPNRPAAHIALRTARAWLSDPENKGKIDMIVFCVFLPVDLQAYREFAPIYFPPKATTRKEQSVVSEGVTTGSEEYATARESASSSPETKRKSEEVEGDAKRRKETPEAKANGDTQERVAKEDGKDEEEEL